MCHDVRVERPVFHLRTGVLLLFALPSSLLSVMLMMLMIGPTRGGAFVHVTSAEEAPQGGQEEEEEEEEMHSCTHSFIHSVCRVFMHAATQEHCDDRLHHERAECKRAELQETKQMSEVH